jgi:hypothetical protein
MPEPYHVVQEIQKFNLPGSSLPPCLPLHILSIFSQTTDHVWSNFKRRSRKSEQSSVCEEIEASLSPSTSSLFLPLVLETDERVCRTEEGQEKVIRAYDTTKVKLAG